LTTDAKENNILVAVERLLEQAENEPTFEHNYYEQNIDKPNRPVL
jgi:hypothetical protein